eukprot:9012802-Pyramimonas_sp.AAC.2
METLLGSDSEAGRASTTMVAWFPEGPQSNHRVLSGEGGRDLVPDRTGRIQCFGQVDQESQVTSFRRLEMDAITFLLRTIVGLPGRLRSTI